MSKSKITKIKWPKNLGLEEWLQLRKEVEGIGKDFVRIGASDVVVAVAPTKWKCPARLYSHLIGEYSNASISEETAAGHALEPIVADRFMGYIPDDPVQSLYNWQYKTKVRKIKKAEFFILNADYPWLSASLDYVPVGKVYSPFTGELYNPLTPIEIKTTKKGYFIMWGGDMPFAYKLQINTQMLLTETKVAVFNVLVDGSNYHVFEVERDDLLCEQIVQETKKFADIVAAGKEAYNGYLSATSDEERFEFQSIYESLRPLPVGVEDDVAFAQETALDPDFENNKREATEEETEWLRSYKTAGEVIKQFEAEKNTAKALLIKSMGEYEEVNAEGVGKIIYRRGREGKKDYLAIK